MTVDQRIEEAARWLLATPRADRPRPVVVELRERFGLSPVDACKALEMVETIKAAFR